MKLSDTTTFDYFSCSCLKALQSRHILTKFYNKLLF